MNKLQRLGTILSVPRNQVIFVLLALVAGTILAITSDILIVPSMILNPLIDPLKVIVISMIAILMAVNLTAILNSRSSHAAVPAIGMGTAAGTLTTACTVCPPIVFAWFGAGATSSLFTELSIYIGAASIIFLTIGLYYSLNDNCEVGKNGKND